VQIGRYTVSVHNHGFFRLDGGAMFGSVPKALWAREAPPDAENRILLATRSLVIEDGEHNILVDLGCGDKWSEKTRAIFRIGEIPPQYPNTPTPQNPLPGVTDVILTHLHFDHAGGVSRLGPSGLEPCYPYARHYVSKQNLDTAKHANLRERASYLAENVDILEQVDLVLTEDGQELFPGLTVHLSHGHTRGLQWIKLTDGATTVAYPADLIPTSKHLPVPYVMGYDMCAERSMEEKARFLDEAVAGGWIVVFEHDPDLAAARLAFDERGRPVVAERIDCAN